MGEQCGEIKDPESLKDLLELFSKLSKETSTVKNLQDRLNGNPEVKSALETGNQNENNAKGSPDDLKNVLMNVNGFYKALVNHTDQGKYAKVEFSDCAGRLFELIPKYLPLLFWLLQFLNTHINLMTVQLGLYDCKGQSTTKKTKRMDSG